MRVEIGLLAAVGVCLLAGNALAHGGFYKGPKTPDGVPLPDGRSGPSTGSGSTTPDALTGGGPAVTGRKGPTDAVTPGTKSLPAGLAEPPIKGTQWEHWWALNKGRYLSLAFERNRRHAGVRTTDDPGAITPDLRKSATDFLVEALRDPAPEVRASAAVAMGRIGARAARPGLLGMVTDEENADVRAMAYVGLAMLPDETSLPALAALLEDPTKAAPDRALAALALGRIGGPDAVAVLRMVLPRKGHRTTQPPVVLATVYLALGLAGDPSAVPLLRDRIEDPKAGHAIVRSFAALALGRLGDRESVALLRRLLTKNGDLSMRRAAGLALGRLATPEHPKAIRDLWAMATASKDPGLRRMCLLSLGGVRSPQVQTSLASHFRSAKPIDRPFTALALALQGHASSGALLREGLAEDEFEESLQAAYAVALGILGDEESDELLATEIGKSHRTWSPGYAGLGLAMAGRVGGADAVHARLAKSKDPRVRSTLLVGLALLADDRAGALLDARLKADSTVYERATGALIAGRVRRDAAAPRLLAMARGGGGEPPILRAAAISGLSRLLAPTGDAPLLDIVDGHNIAVELTPLLRVAEALNER